MHRNGGRELELAIEPVGEILAREQLHHHEEAVLGVVPDVEHLDDVFALDAARRARLDAEPRHDLFVLDVLRLDELYGDAPAELDVLSLEDGSERSTAMEAGELVFPLEDRADAGVAGHAPSRVRALGPRCDDYVLAWSFRNLHGATRGGRKAFDDLPSAHP